MAADATVMIDDALMSIDEIADVTIGVEIDGMTTDRSHGDTARTQTVHMALASHHIDVMANVVVVNGNDPIDVTANVHSARMVVGTDMDTNLHKAATVAEQTGGTDRMEITVDLIAMDRTRDTDSHTMGTVRTVVITANSLPAIITSKMEDTTAHGTIVELKDIDSPGTNMDSAATVIIDIIRTSTDDGTAGQSVDISRDALTIVDFQDPMAIFHHIGPYLVESTRTTTERSPKTKS